MVTPTIPNFNPAGAGRLATDRYDFEKHITGAAFRHTADQIDLTSPLTINSVLTTTVEQAIVQLSDIINPILNQATTLQFGTIKLSGDLSGGTASNLKVTGLQGKPVSATAPNNGQVLTWSSSISAWLPETPATYFSAGGDLSGNNTAQAVIGMTGSSGMVSISASNLTFSSASVPIISQTIRSISGSGFNFTIGAQSATSASSNGGNILLNGGSAGSGGLRGGVSLSLDSGNTNMVQATEVASGTRVLSLLNTYPVSTSNMPSGTGDMVLFFGNTGTPPTSGSPVGGTIVYSYQGQLWVKQSNGISFAVGSIPNPSIWGTNGQETYTYKNYVSSTASSAANALTYALPNDSTTKVDVIFTGKAAGSSDAACFNLSMAYSRHSNGSPVALGTVTSADPRTTSSAAAGWVTPNITVSGNNLIVTTGYSPIIIVYWMVVVQLVISGGV
jgi:hypothetical protein